MKLENEIYESFLAVMKMPIFAWIESYISITL